jgi:release factor glutamine methyltransferase
MERRFFRLFWLPLYRRWALRFIQRERVFEYAGLRLWVPPGVFHPGVFFSTPLFVSFLQNVDFHEKTVLDVGTGSGLLALFAAHKGGLVTALDINPLATQTALRNAASNGLSLTAVVSDLFDALPPQAFDVVLINPPYYPRAPRNAAEHAFFAGEGLAYFEKLFAQLPRYIHPATKTWMVLSEDCDLLHIRAMAAARGFGWAVVFQQKKWGERFFVVGLTST